jgi:alpha-glucosidase
MLDVPVRPHVANFDNAFETAPDRVGETASNLANLRLRYALLPTLYSLAYRASVAGTPVVAPLWLHYPADPATRTLANHKAIGPDIVTVAVADGTATTADIYLPEGRWLGFHDQTWRDGGWHREYPLRHHGIFRLPLFFRQGAIVPMAPIDDQTMNTLGRRRDGSTANELVVRIAAGVEATQTVLYEDDGLTTAHRTGAHRSTPIRQQQAGGVVRVDIGPAVGTYDGAPDTRALRLDLSLEGEIAGVSIGEVTLPQVAAAEGMDGWWMAEPGRVVVRIGAAPVAEARSFKVAVNR